ncbi:phospholipid phosphatase-related protein type 1-like [Patiria miniata]|uniref:Phosphatidic acid phosphatase type 2/haloperoxidase domain-containing protein n=1 Tax=Patiria miniata TaxID=46514 RepID=A0A913ZEP8_PATMI|nr:phospholipid phosphatase-related protein type 1-like [Patiria miniata]XP_038049533.1 phospholipid phosphatase-related protein type 1-like [Patiria miniata]
MVDDHRWCSTTEPYQDQRGRLVSKNTWLVPCFLGVDYVLFAGVGVLWFLLEFTYYLPAPAKRGFWCNERQYMMPYIEDEIVPERGLYVISFAAPVILILSGESMLALCKCDKTKESLKMVHSCSLKLYTPLRRAFRFIGIFSLGGFATWVITDFIQIVTGRMTPYFFAACDPDACSPVYGAADTRFVTDYTCLNEDYDLIKQARRSLPSIHASLGAYSSVFATVYLSTQMQFRNVRLPVPLFCLAYVSCAVIWGLSRAASHRNHWSDVLAGFILGTSIALYLSLVILRVFQERPAKPHSNLTASPSKGSGSMFSIEEQHFMQTAPSSFVLPRVQHCADTLSTSHVSQQNGIAAGHNPSYADDMVIIHHQAQPGVF